MNIAAITPKNPACFGVCCSVHDRCARYAMVNKAPASTQFIGMCYDPAQTDYPLFLEKSNDLHALRKDAREPGLLPALPEVPVLRSTGDMASGALAPATGRERGQATPDAGRVDGVGTPGNRLEAAVEPGGHAAGAVANKNKEVGSP